MSLRTLHIGHTVRAHRWARARGFSRPLTDNTEQKQGKAAVFLTVAFANSDALRPARAIHTERVAARAARRAVRVLRSGKLKMSARDAARLLGLSHQRVHQLTEAEGRQSGRTPWPPWSQRTVPVEAIGCEKNPQFSDANAASMVALVAGATRGAGRGIAVELGAAAATVYVTGRTTRQQASEYGRRETIEETAELVGAAGGTGIAVRVDHLVPAEVAQLVDRIRAEAGRLDILVNDVWGGENLFEWDTPVWEHNLEKGLRLLDRGVRTHLITAHCALPLLIARPGGLLVEVTDGTAEYNATNYRINPFDDLAKVSVNRLAWPRYLGYFK